MAEELQRYIVKIDIVTDTRQMTQGIQQATTQLSNLDKTLSRIQRSFISFLAIWAGRELINQIGAMVTEFADFEFQLALVGRAAGITGEDLVGLGNSLRQVALDTGFSIKGLEDTALAAGRAGIKTANEMTNIATVVAKFSTITGVSAETATVSIIKLQKNFGYSAQQIASSIAWAGKEVLATEGDITQAVLRMIDSGKTLGFDFPTLVGLAAVSMESAGQRASRVGNEWSAAIRKLAENADLISISLGIKTPQAFRELINSRPDEALFATALALEKIQDNTLKVNLETKLFGATGGKVLPYLRENFARVKEVIGGVGEELKTNGKYLDESWGKVSEQLKIKIQKLNTAFGDLKLTIAEVIDEPLADFITEWAKSIREFNEEIKKTNLLWASFLALTSLGPIAQISKILGAMSVKLPEDLRTDKTKEILKNVNLGKVNVTGAATTPTEGVTGPSPNTIAEINAEADKIQKMKDMWAAYRSEELAATMQKNQTEMEQYSFMIETQKQAHSSLWSVAGQLRDTFSAGISNMFMDMIKGTFDAKKAFADLGMQMLKILIDWAVQRAVAMALDMALMPVLKGMAAAAALMWATPATLAAIATGGLIAVAAEGAIAGAIASTKAMAGFQKGGLVPGIGRGDTVPALLEPGEYVVPRNRVNQMTNNSNVNVNVSMAGAYIMDDPIAVEKLYREYLQPRIKQDIKSGRDRFYS